MLWAGWIFAAITGMILPVFFWMIGDVFDAFQPADDSDDDRDKTLDKILKLFYFMVGLSAALTLTASLYHSFTAKASANIY